MPMPNRLILLLHLSSLLFFSLLIATPVLSVVLYDDEADEDLRFLAAEEEKERASKSSPYPKFVEAAQDDDDFEVPSDIDSDDDGYAHDEALHPGVDDKDVVVLTERNFTDFIETNKYVLVKFYAPWCGHCKAMAPEYAAAATELKGWENEKVHLAKVRATLESDLADKYNVLEYPTLYLFIDGEHKPYPGQTSKHAIVSWIKKKIGPGVENINTIEDAERILTAEEKVALGFLNSLVGPESEELAAASKVHDDVNFYQTVNPDGEFTNQKIAEFVFANKMPLVTTFTRETAQKIFESPIKKQVLLFTTSSDSVELVSTFQEAAKLFRGKLIFVHMKMDDAEIGGPIAEYFGLEGNTSKVFGYTGDDNQKYMFDGEITLENFKVFGADFVEDKIKPFYRSDPIPETNDGDVKIVVGNNFEEIVLDDSKDVLLEIYAPWCRFSQALEPTYNKLARHLHGTKSLVLAKMDGTTNEHPRAKDTGYPTLLLFPAGKKSSDPIPVDTGRTLVALYKFIKKHASIPFKLQKGTNSDVIKDEL